MKKSDFAFYASVIVVCVAIAYLLTRCGSEDPSDASINSEQNYVVLQQTTTPDDSAGVSINASDADSKSQVADSKHKERTTTKASAPRNKKSSTPTKRRKGAGNATETTPISEGQGNISSVEGNQSSTPIGDAQNDSITDVQNQPDDATANDTVSGEPINAPSEAPVDTVPENEETVNEEEQEDSEDYDEDAGSIADGLLNGVLTDVLSEDTENASGLVEYDGMIGHIVYDTARVWKRTVQPYYQRITYGGEQKTKKVAEIYCLFLSNTYEFTRTSYFADRDMEIEEQGSAHVSLIQKNDIVIAKIFVCEKGWKVIEIEKNLSR
jgi:hypothetical protein